MHFRQSTTSKFALAAAVLAACLTAAATNVAKAGPYAPAAGQSGSTAIHMDDACFVAWATGYTNYVVGTDVTPTAYPPENALGKAVGSSYDIVCLGNGGAITLTFDKPICDGEGWDFATFENSFNDTFLELGYVEVSSDGTNFFRFANDSLTASPVAAFGAVDPTNIDGYCSKYRQGYGTPFDLADLAGIDGLDIDNVGYVKIIDIVGDGTYLDSSDDVIYDPHKTTGTGGVDLDAIGVIHEVPEPGAVVAILGGLLLLAARRLLRSGAVLAGLCAIVAFCAPFLAAPAANAEAYYFADKWVDVDYWAGSGESEALIVIDWNNTNGPYVSESHAWGYRWDGTKKIVDALTALDEAGALSITTGYGGAFFNDAYYVDDDGDNHSTAGYTGWWASAEGTDGVTWKLNGGIGGSLKNGYFEGMNTDSGAWTTATLTTPFTVPEPGTIAMLLGALACGGFASRGRDA